jgi:hypothetical protein
LLHESKDPAAAAASIDCPAVDICACGFGDRCLLLLLDDAVAAAEGHHSFKGYFGCWPMMGPT